MTAVSEEPVFDSKNFFNFTTRVVGLGVSLTWVSITHQPGDWDLDPQNLAVVDDEAAFDDCLGFLLSGRLGCRSLFGPIFNLVITTNNSLSPSTAASVIAEIASTVSVTIANGTTANSTATNSAPAAVESRPACSDNNWSAGTAFFILVSLALCCIAHPPGALAFNSSARVWRIVPLFVFAETLALLNAVIESTLMSFQGQSFFFRLF